MLEWGAKQGWMNLCVKAYGQGVGFFQTFIHLCGCIGSQMRPEGSSLPHLSLRHMAFAVVAWGISCSAACGILVLPHSPSLQVGAISPWSLWRAGDQRCEHHSLPLSLKRAPPGIEPMSLALQGRILNP